jgi:hypothetical protein
MNTHETMMEQIRRLNQEQARVHEQRREQALKKIHERRKQQKQHQLSDS